MGLVCFLGLIVALIVERIQICSAKNYVKQNRSMK